MRQPSRLDLHTVDIEDIRFGDTTAVEGSTLVVSAEEIATALGAPSEADLQRRREDNGEED